MKHPQSAIAARSAKLNEYYLRKQSDAPAPDRGKQILKMTVQLNTHENAELKVFEMDDVDQIANQFCTEHKIKPKFGSVLVKTIIDNLNGVEKTRPISPDESPNSPSPIKQRTEEDITVYDRLFKDAEKKRVKLEQRRKEQEDQHQPLKRTPSEDQQRRWESLYRLGIEKSQEQKCKADKIRIERDREIKEECTHKPKINELSRTLAKPRQQPFGQHLINQGKLSKEKIEQQKTYQQSQEEACTFHPQINPISAIIVDERRKNGHEQSGFEQLHLQYKSREEKLQAKTDQFYGEKCPFKPKIDEISQRIVEGTNFLGRQEVFLQQKEIIQSKALEEKKSNESHLFKPQICIIHINISGRPPLKSQGPEDPFASLYLRWKEKAQEREKRQDLADQQLKQASLTQASALSNRIVEISRTTALSTLFDQLDNDGDGKISYYRLNYDCLDSKRSECLKPLLEEMKTKNAEVTKEMFVSACTQLLQQQTIQGRHDLIFGDRGKKGDQTPFTFHPVINAKSQRIASKKKS